MVPDVIDKFTGEKEEEMTEQEVADILDSGDVGDVEFQE